MITDWIARHATKASVIALLLLLILGALWLRSCNAGRVTATEVKLAAGQADAALASGQDASAVLGNRIEADAATDRITKENDLAIHNAPGAAAPVDPALRDAGLASLCRRAAYRGNARCMQLADPR